MITVFCENTYRQVWRSFLRELNKHHVHVQYSVSDYSFTLQKMMSPSRGWVFVTRNSMDGVSLLEEEWDYKHLIHNNTTVVRPVCHPRPGIPALPSRDSRKHRPSDAATLYFPWHLRRPMVRGHFLNPVFEIRETNRHLDAHYYFVYRVSAKYTYTVHNFY